MKRILIPLGLIAAVALPVTAAAAPTKADKREGKQECRELQRVVDTRANFVQVVRLEAKANRKNAFGRCVKVRTSDATVERNSAFKQAKAACEPLRRSPGTKGKPADPGAYGKCVDCGDAITYERLDAYPTAKRCITCQSRHENRRGGRDATPSL